MSGLITQKEGIAILDPETSRRIADFERKMKEIQRVEDEIRRVILEEMQEKKISKIETDELLITYIATTDRQTFDVKAFRKEHPDLHDEYIKISPVKESVRIKLKEGKA